MSTPLLTEQPDRARWQWPALGLGVIALVACIIGAVFDPAQFFRAYLAAYMFYLGLALGGMAILMLYHLTGGAWGFLIRRLLEAQMRTLPLLAVFFTPIAVGVGYLYLWAQPEVVAGDSRLQYQQFYLNPPFFWGRVAIYFVLWLVLAYFLSSWSRREDETGEPRYPWRNLQLSGPGLIIYGITIHFASIDWLMSLEPRFPSTIWGPLTATSQLLTAQAFSILALTLMVDRRPIADVFSLKALNDLGNLLFAFLVAWAYMVWFQFMIVWIGNLPDDVIWYTPRAQGVWPWIGVAFLVLQFAIPFFLLLLRAVKQSPRHLAAVAGLVLFMQLVFSYFEVLPAFRTTRISEHWMDFLTPIGIGGIWLAYFLHQWKRWPVLPRHDYNEAQAVHLRQTDEEEATREEALVHG